MKIMTVAQEKKLIENGIAVGDTGEGSHLKPVIKLFGGVKAIIYEEVRSLSKQEGHCFASYQYIADDLGMSRETIRRNIQELIKAGAIKDLKTNPRNTLIIYPE